MPRTRLPVRKRFLMCEAIGPESAKNRSLSPSVFAYLHVARAVLGVLASGTKEGLDEAMMTETQRKKVAK